MIFTFFVLRNKKKKKKGKKNRGNLSLIPKTCVISWSNIIESTSYSWKIDVCSKNWKILPVMNFQPMMDLKKNSIEDVFDSSHLEGQYKDSIDLRFIF